MRLDSDGTSFELRVLGYEFPEGGVSANWLAVEVAVEGPIGSWAARHASLESGDLLWLADWLSALADGAPADREVAFEEPTLEFELLDRSGESVTLRIWLELELRPPWAPSPMTGMRDVWIDVRVSHDAIREAASSLERDFRRFPTRPEAVQRWPSEQPAAYALEVRSRSPEETEAVAARLAARLRSGDVVTVAGELGSGKTTFIRGACRALGVTGPVTSPTFTIGHRYDGVSHLDLYRFEKLSPADWGALEPYFEDAICFVEWPEAAAGWLTEPRIAVRLVHVDPSRRRIELESAEPGLLAGLI